MKKFPILVLISGGLSGCTLNLHQYPEQELKPKVEDTDSYVQKAVVNFIELLDRPVSTGADRYTKLTTNKNYINQSTNSSKTAQNVKLGVSIPLAKKPELSRWNLNPNRKLNPEKVNNQHTQAAKDKLPAIKKPEGTGNAKPIIRTAAASAVPRTSPVILSWRITKGQTLRDGVTFWASKYPCKITGSKGWNVIWATDVNYSIDAPLEFKGDFQSALKELFELYLTAKKPLYAETITSQCLIRVIDSNLD